MGFGGNFLAAAMLVLMTGPILAKGPCDDIADSKKKLECLNKELSAKKQALQKVQQQEAANRQAQIKAQQDVQRQTQMTTQQNVQRQAQLKAQQDAQRQAQVVAQQNAQRQAQLKAQQDAQRQAQIKAQQDAQRQAQFKAKPDARQQNLPGAPQNAEGLREVSPAPLRMGTSMQGGTQTTVSPKLGLPAPMGSGPSFATAGSSPAVSSKPVPIVQFVSCGPSAGGGDLKGKLKAVAIRTVGQAHEIITAVGKGYSFDAACKMHDSCYGRCGRDRSTKVQCDEKFGRDMGAICEVLPKGSDDHRKCENNRLVYWGLVIQYGEGAYANACKGGTGLQNSVQNTGSAPNGQGIAMTGSPGSVAKYGQAIGEYRGVVAYSNGDCTAKSDGGCAPENNGKWQCVDLIKRSYPRNAQINVPWGSAKSFWTKQAGNPSPGLTVIPNDGRSQIIAGDIVFFDARKKDGTYNPYGHVALATDRAQQPVVEVLQQNIDRNSAYATLRLDSAARRYVYVKKENTFVVLGWIRIKN